MQMVESPFFEPEEYRGLVFKDGVDAMGRPVILVRLPGIWCVAKSYHETL